MRNPKAISLVRFWPAERHGSGVLDGIVGKYGDIAGAAAKIHDGHADFALFIGKNGLGGCQCLEHNVGNLKIAALAGTDDILRRSDRSGDNMHMRFQPVPGHADRVGNAELIVHDIFLRKNVYDLAAGRNGHGLGRLDDALDVPRVHFLAVLEGNGPVGVGSLDVAACDARINRPDFTVGHAFRFFHRLADGLHGLFDIDHHTLAQTGGRAFSDADDVHRSVIRSLAHHTADFGGAYIKANDEFGLGHAVPPKERSWTPLDGKGKHDPAENARIFLHNSTLSRGKKFIINP